MLAADRRGRLAGRPRRTRRSPSRAGFSLTPEPPAWRAWLAVVLALRAFASGCTALTGVEAISNGVPALQAAEGANAARTLAMMGGLTIIMFAGITALALVAHVHVADDPCDLIGAPAGYEQRTVIAQLAARGLRRTSSSCSSPSRRSPPPILVLAANTAFNGFPILASILGRRRLPAPPVAHAAATGWCSPTASCCSPLLAGAADLRLRRRRSPGSSSSTSSACSSRSR